MRSAAWLSTLLPCCVVIQKAAVATAEDLPLCLVLPPADDGSLLGQQCVLCSDGRVLPANKDLQCCQADIHSGRCFSRAAQVCHALRSEVALCAAVGMNLGTETPQTTEVQDPPVTCLWLT